MTDRNWKGQLSLRAVEETLTWHETPPDGGDTMAMSTEYELAITQLRAVLAALRDSRRALKNIRDAAEGLLDQPGVRYGPGEATATDQGHFYEARTLLDQRKHEAAVVLSQVSDE